MGKFDTLEDQLQYKFKNPRLLETAMTHSSYAAEKKGRMNNQRLEFLGDAVLELCISEYLFDHCSTLAEGELTKLRAAIVSEKPLAQAAKAMGLHNLIILGAGEKNSGGAEKPSIVSDAFEALSAAVYLDGGMEKAREMILHFLSAQIKEAMERKKPMDYKTTLQEHLQKNGSVNIVYTLIGRAGPAHETVFSVEVSCEGKLLGRGEGTSKKQAEQQAARQALAELGQL